MKQIKACRMCKMIAEGDVCPNCDSRTFTTFWRGYIVVLDSEKSEIVKKIGINNNGKYALIISR